MKRKTVVALLATMTLTAGSVGTVFAMNSSQFSDVKTGASYFNYVQTVYDAEIMQGLSENEFGVEEKEKRSDFIQSLYVMAQKPVMMVEMPFDDVEAAEDQLAISWASQKGLFEGLKADFFQNGKFDAEKALSREEMAVILYNYAKNIDRLDMTYGIGSYNSFADQADNKVSEEYSVQMKWAVGNQILVGDDRLTDEVENNLRPTTEVNKTEVAEALAKYMDLRDALNAEAVKARQTENKEAEQDKSETVKEHQHSWVDNYTTVHHDEVGHWENQKVKDAWSEEVKHDAEGHYEKELVKDAWSETVHHDAKYEDKWVVDHKAWTEEIRHPEKGHTESVLVKDAWVETIEHPEEGHTESVLVKEAYDEVVNHPAEYEDRYIVDQEAVYDTIHHDAVYEDKYIVDQEAVYDTVHHDAVYEDKYIIDKEAWDEPVYEIGTRFICSVCGADITNMDIDAEQSAHMLAGEGSGWHTEQRQVQVDTIHHPEEGHTESVLVKEAYDEQVLVSPEVGHTESVLVKEAWEETISRPAEYEDKWVVDKEAWTETINHEAEYEDKYIVDEEAWVETIEHPEEGHMETVCVQEAYDEVVEHEAEYKDVWVEDKAAWVETVYHEAEYKDVWVVDVAAYDEQVLDGKVCSGCGEVHK